MIIPSLGVGDRVLRVMTADDDPGGRYGLGRGICAACKGKVAGGEVDEHLGWSCTANSAQNLVVLRRCSQVCGCQNADRLRYYPPSNLSP